ncbi:MAG: cytochrome c oxidase subunit II [Cyanobacteriota bacterium]|nr:cytochrome c oxidase subunit II [Cyanobacteriota bacterium]
MSVFNNIILVALGIGLTLVSLWYGHNHHLLPAEASLEAPLFDGLFDTTMVIATGIFLVVQGLLLYSAIRFRRQPGDNRDGDPVHGNVLLEIVWTAIPAVVVLWLAVASLDVYQAMGSGVDPGGHTAHAMPMMAESEGMGYQPAIAAQKAPGVPDLVVKVSGMQYAWLFTYPETGVVTGELHLPVNKRIRLDMVAQDVNHAFWVPQFRLKQDLIAGRETHLEFTPTQVGEYPIVCAELCGPYHGAMQGQLMVEDGVEFLAWQESQLIAQGGSPSRIASLSSTAASSFAEQQSQTLGVDVETLHQLAHTGSHPSS